MKPVISFKERCERIQKESKFKGKITELELKEKAIAETLRVVNERLRGDVK